MAIITVSRGSYSMGRQVAEQTAERLGYQCISREVIIEASDHFNIPELKLEHAIKDAPSILDRIGHGQQRYVAYVQSALATHMLQDDVVYHGIAGHLLLKNVSHLLKVRIVADIERRADIAEQREGTQRRSALARIKRLDKTRRKWTKSLYGVDPADPLRYDLVVQIGKYEVADAVDLMCRSAQLPQFQTTDQSRQQIQDLALACEVKAELVEKHPDVAVACTYGNVVVYASSDRQLRRLQKVAPEFRERFEGINNIEVHLADKMPADAV